MEFSFYQLIPSIIIVISGVSTAIYVAGRHTKIARSKATLDVILKTEDDQYYQELFSEFLELWYDKTSFLHLSALDIENLKDPDNDWPIEIRNQRKTLDRFLNHYEIIGIGICANILDEEMYKNWWRTAFVTYYRRSFNYIYYIQCEDYAKSPEEKPKTFKNYSHYVCEWMTEEEKDKLNSKRLELQQELKDAGYKEDQIYFEKWCPNIRQNP